MVFVAVAERFATNHAGVMWVCILMVSEGLSRGIGAGKSELTYPLWLLLCFTFHFVDLPDSCTVDRIKKRDY